MRFHAAITFLVMSLLCGRADGDTPAPVAPQTTWVSSAFSLDLAGENPSTGTYRATGLPKGLSLNPKTGLITGTVTAKPGFYRVKYWSQNGSVKSPVQTTTFTVNAFPAQMVGKFESLLLGIDDGTLPIGKIQITVTSNGVYTGTLVTTYEKKAYALRGQLNFSPDLSAARNYLIIKRKIGEVVFVPTIVFPTDTSMVLSVAIGTNSALTAFLGLTVGDPKDGTAAVIGESFDSTTILPAKTREVAWIGRYTLSLPSRPFAFLYGSYADSSFYDPTFVFTDGRPAPFGTGYATATVAANGVLTIRGKTADGNPFTALLASAPDASYRAFIKPYKTDRSYLGGWLNLIPQNDSPPANPLNFTRVESELYWEKKASPAAKSYPEGFGPVVLGVNVEHWNRTVSLAGTFPLMLDHPSVSNADLNADRLPVSISLISSYGATFTAPSDPVNPSKWTLKVNRSTGVFAGSFKVTRNVNGKATLLSVPFQGVLRQPFPASSGGSFGDGFFLLPPNDDTGATTVSGSLQILTP